MSLYEPEGTLLMRCLMLLNDQHGYIRPDEVFCPGWEHERINGELKPKPEGMFALPVEVAKQLIAQKKACWACPGEMNRG